MQHIDRQLLKALALVEWQCDVAADVQPEDVPGLEHAAACLAAGVPLELVDVSDALRLELEDIFKKV